MDLGNVADFQATPGDFVPVCERQRLLRAPRVEIIIQITFTLSLGARLSRAPMQSFVSD